MDSKQEQPIHFSDSPELQKAIELATKAHEGQVDKSGQPYIGHPLRVMRRLTNPVDMMTAVLHDVIEDTKITLDDLKRAGVDEIVVAAVDVLTKRKGDVYENYLARVKANPVARRVKLADIRDNTDPERLSKLPIEQQERLKKKYDVALKFITDDRLKVAKIISGGQTGADQGALDGAINYGLDYGGWIPRGRKSEKGCVPGKYEHMKELDSPDYLKRTEANVVDSDATLIFSYGDLEGGSLKTADYAKKHNRPFLHVNLEKLNKEEAVKSIVAWIESCPTNLTLNVAGSRGSKSPTIQEAVELIIVDVLNEVNGFKVYPIHESKPMILREKT